MHEQGESELAGLRHAHSGELTRLHAEMAAEALAAQKQAAAAERAHAAAVASLELGRDQAIGVWRARCSPPPRPQLIGRGSRTPTRRRSIPPSLQAGEPLSRTHA